MANPLNRIEQLYNFIKAGISNGQNKDELLTNVRNEFGQETVTEQEMDVFYSKYKCSCLGCHSLDDKRCSRSQLPFHEPSFHTPLFHRNLCQWSAEKSHLFEFSTRGEFPIKCKYADIYSLKSMALMDDRYCLNYGPRLNKIRVIDMWSSKSSFLTSKHSSIVDEELIEFDPFRSVIQQVYSIGNNHLIFFLGKDTYVQQHTGITDDQPTRFSRQNHLNRHARRRLLNDLLNKRRPKKPVTEKRWQGIGVAKLDMDELTFEFVSMNSLKELPKRFSVNHIYDDGIRVGKDFGLQLLNKNEENADLKYPLQLCRLDKNYKMELTRRIDRLKHKSYFHVFENKVYCFGQMNSLTNKHQIDFQKLFVCRLDKNDDEEWETVNLQLDEGNGMRARIVKEKNSYREKTHCWHENKLYLKVIFDGHTNGSLIVFDVYSMEWKRLKFDVLGSIGNISVDSNDNLILFFHSKVISYFYEHGYFENTIFRIPTRKPEPLFQLTYFEFNKLSKKKPKMSELENKLSSVKGVFKKPCEIGQDKEKAIPCLVSSNEFLSNFYLYTF